MFTCAHATRILATASIRERWLFCSAYPGAATIQEWQLIGSSVWSSKYGILLLYLLWDCLPPHWYWCCWFCPLLRRIQWGCSWWRWGTRQSAAVDPSEQPTGRSQPHLLHPLRARRYHSAREKRNVTPCRGRCDYHGEVWLLIYHDILPP